MFCKNCGHELPEDAKFCMKCGTLLKSESSSTETDGKPIASNAEGSHPYINIGAFLSAVITFLITAFCVFLIVKAVNTMRNLTLKKKEEEKKEEPEKVAPDIALLTEIRDLLKQQQNEETKR